MPGGTRGFDPGRLRALRAERGLTQAELAERVGVRRTYLVQWERLHGRATAPSARPLRRLADVLQVRPCELTSIEPEQALLSDLRAWAGLSQPELARALQVPETTLSAVERGRRPLHASLAERLAAHLCVPVDEVRRAYNLARQGNVDSAG